MDLGDFHMRQKQMISFGFRTVGPIEPVFHTHVQHEIYYFHEGKCNYLIGDKIYELAPGDLLLMHGMTLHCAKIDPTVPYVRSVIHFDSAAVRPFADMPQAIDLLKPFRELKNYRLSLRGDDREEAERLLATMDRHRRRGDRVGAQRMMLAFADLACFVYDKCRQPLSGRSGQPESKKSETAQEIITYLERHFASELNLDLLQRQLHLSKHYLTRVFKDVTGTTIFEFVYRRRINEAQILFMLDSRRSVTDVCFEVGFKHPAHFSRLFKQHVGVTPESFRKRQRELG